MALEQDISELVLSSDRLTATMEQQIDSLEQRTVTAEKELQSFIDNAKGEQAYYCLSKNQELMGTTGHVPDHWNSGNGVTYTLVQSVNHNVEWLDRTVEEQELLTAMGRKEQMYVYKPFNIWRLDWVTSADRHLMHQQVNGATVFTVGAMTKLLSGEAFYGWAQGATNEWKLTGQHEPLRKHRYHHIHPYRLTGSGSMLVALPAAIAGYVPLNPKTWGNFPYIGDTQDD